MARNNANDNLQKWRRTDTTAGYAVYKNVQTGRGLQGFPVGTAQTCVAGATNQQWRLNVTKDFVLRLNGVAAKHNLAGAGTHRRLDGAVQRPARDEVAHPPRVTG